MLTILFLLLELDFFHIENKCNCKFITDGVVTMRSLFSELRPYLQNLRYICIVHRRAVYANFKTEDNWKCALRFLNYR